MVLVSYRSRKDHFVKEMCDNIAQDASFKDLVLLVDGDQLAYHSQILRNVLPFLKNILPNPGNSCSCDTILSSSTAMFITLDGVSPRTVSNLMSSIYNPHKPILLSVEEMEKIRELLTMLGADPNRYNMCVDTTDTIPVQTGEMEVDDHDSGDLNKGATRDYSSTSNTELLLNEKLVEPCAEALDTVNEVVMEDCQLEGSFSSTVPQDDEHLDLEESVEDEEITFSVDGSTQEGGMDEILSPDVSSPKSQDPGLRDTGVSLDMVDDFINEDADLDEDIVNSSCVENIVENKKVFPQSEAIDEDIEVIAEVVDGVTEVVSVVGQSNGIQTLSVSKHDGFEMIEAEQDKKEICLKNKEIVDLVETEDKLDEMHETAKLGSYEMTKVIASKIKVCNEEGGVNEDDSVISQDKDKVEIENDSATKNEICEDIVVEDHRDPDMVNNRNQKAISETNSFELKLNSSDEVDMDSTEDLGIYNSFQESNSINQHQSEADHEDQQEEFDDDLIEDEAGEASAVARVSMEISVKEKETDSEHIDSVDCDVDEEARRDGLKKPSNFSDEQVEEDILYEEETDDDEVDAELSDGDKSDKDVDLQNLSAPLEDVKRVKRDLSDSFDLGEEEVNEQLNDPEVKEGTECASVSVAFKGDDLELITDIPALKKRALSEEVLVMSDDEDRNVKKARNGDFNEDDQSSGYEESSDEESYKKDNGDPMTHKGSDSDEDNVVKRTKVDDLPSYVGVNDHDLKKADGKLSVKWNKLVKSSDENDDPTEETENDENVELSSDDSSGSEELDGDPQDNGQVIPQETPETHSDNEDPDLFNIDEDDVDMLNEQIDPSNSMNDQYGCDESKVVDTIEDNMENMSSVEQIENSSVTSGDTGKPDDSDSLANIDLPVHKEEHMTDATEVSNAGTSNGDFEERSTAVLSNMPYQMPIEEGKVQDPPGLSCTLCPNQPAFKRGQLLMHLTDKHYSKDLLHMFPFIEGSSCQLCVDTSRARVTTCKTKANHVKHVGTVHEKVLELVPTDLREAVLAVSKRRASMSVREVDNESLDGFEVQNQEKISEVISTIKEESTMKDDSTQADADAGEDTEVPEVKSENVIEKATEVQGVNAGQCPFCPNTKTQFQRSTLLNHLSSTHYNKQLLDAFPYQEGTTCQLCLETGRQNPLIARSKPRFVTHVGSLHEKVLDFIPPNLRDSLEGTKKVLTRTTRRSVINRESQDAAATSLTLAVRLPAPGPSSSRGPAPGPPMAARPVPGPPSTALATRSLPKSLSVSVVPEDRLASLGNLSISKVQEKVPTLPKLSNVSISKIE
eukprot:GFUD01040899.1.p1 GENE.GFUD01040899.1~~GFUD01040899.1.p1  ORF type:complete len:1304 (+),score=404.79 GFUD01040899.1:44-3955(+)